MATIEFVFDLVQDSVFTRTMGGTINFWNRSAEAIYGWRKEEAIGRVSHNLLQTIFPKPLEEIESELVRNGVWKGRLVHKTRDGRQVVVESRWALPRDGQSEALVEINTPSSDEDLSTKQSTDGVKPAVSLTEQTTTPLQQQEYLIDLIKDCVITRATDGTIKFWNQGAENLYGWRKEEAIGRVSHDILRTQFSTPLEAINSELVRNRRWEGKLVHTTRDGRQVVVKSQWSVEHDRSSAALIEINTPSNDRESDSNIIIRPQSLAPASSEHSQKTKPRNVEVALLKFTNLVIVGGGVVSLFVLFYFLYHYAWTAQRHFVSQIAMMLCYGLPASLAVVLFTSLRLSPASRGNLAIVLLSTCISLYAVELVLGFYDRAILGIEKTLWFPPDTTRELKEIIDTAKKFGVDFDTRSKLQIVDDLSQRGVKAVPVIVPQGLLKLDANGTLKSEIAINGTEVLPLAGMSNIVTVLCNESGKYVIFDSDQHGFHNPNEIWDSRQFDIAAVGDSYTQGYCVPSDKNFVALIRRNYPSTLNLGVAGDGPLTALATLKEYVQFTKPKVLLWFFWEGNDLVDLKREKTSPLLMRYLNSDFSQNLVHRQPDIDAAVAVQIEKARRNLSLERHPKNLPEGQDGMAIKAKKLGEMSESTIRLSNLRQRLGLVSKPVEFETTDATAVSEDEIKLLEKVLTQAKTTINEWGGAAYFIYLPERDRYVDWRTAKVDDRDREQVLRIAKSAGFSVIDINDVFQSQADPVNLFPFRRLGHYNEQGHRVVADAVLESLAK